MTINDLLNQYYGGGYPEGVSSWEDVAAAPFIQDVARDWRQEKLSSSDWTQVSDSPLSTEKKQEWAVYRQELRDLPATVLNGLATDLPVEP